MEIEIQQNVDIISMLSQFDVISRVYHISLARQLQHKNTKLNYFLLIYTAFTTAYQITIFLLISDNETQLLAKYGSFGYYLDGANTQFMADMTAISMKCMTACFLTDYHFISKQWIHKVNDIYNELRTDKLDIYLLGLCRKLIILLKISSYTFTIVPIFVYQAIWF